MKRLPPPEFRARRRLIRDGMLPTPKPAGSSRRVERRAPRSGQCSLRDFLGQVRIGTARRCRTATVRSKPFSVPHPGRTFRGSVWLCRLTPLTNSSRNETECRVQTPQRFRVFAGIGIYQRYGTVVRTWDEPKKLSIKGISIRNASNRATLVCSIVGHITDLCEVTRTAARGSPSRSAACGR